MRGDRLIRLDGTDRILSREECETVVRRVFAMAQGGGETRVQLSSWWQGELRWARNRVSLASDRRAVGIRISRGARFAGGASVFTNQLDDVSLQAAVRAAERVLDLHDRPRDPQFAPPLPAHALPKPAVWSDATVNLTAEARGQIARALVDPAEEQGMLSAGYVEVRAASTATLSSAAREGSAVVPEQPYAAWTQAQCSMTVRDVGGTGSGWAGLSSYDWAKIDGPKLAAEALDRCVRSRNPVRLEPGRYTTILAPTAVADLVTAVVNLMDRPRNEGGGYPFQLGPDEMLGFRSKLGLKVADERVTISHDLMDPDLGFVPEWEMSADPIAWIRNGVLESLAYRRDYALRYLNDPWGARPATAFRMSGGDTSLDEMIRTTRRGLLVTRFHGIRLLDIPSVLCTGITRDGLWLIENGKITKAVKNFRFTESALFALNSIEQLGEPVRVFRPTLAGAAGTLTPAIVPPLKVRDFSFTSLVDAV